MKTSLEQKLMTLMARYEEVALLLSTLEVAQDQKAFRELSKEYADLQLLVQTFTTYQQQKAQKQSLQALLEDEDLQLREMAKEEAQTLEAELAKLEAQLQILLLPPDLNDSKNVFLEIRAGTGGSEAAIFAGDLFRMYARYAEQKKWQVEILSDSEGEHGGYKEIIAKFSGQAVYAHLKFESGAHRVQRVPATESQGRIHTSACTVAILPEAAQMEDITLNTAELRIDTYRSSGAGGQHVNKTDSAVRITHLPSGIVVECQEERSQHKNKAKALALLQAKLTDSQREAQRAKESATRRDLVGTGDRSERIRTYNFPQGRVTDHRINLTLYKLEEIMQGKIDGLVEALRQEHQADQLLALAT